MAEVLSQNEIDNLLSALSTGAVDAEEIKKESEGHKVKVYDFRRPDKLSKEQIRTLQMIHENLARLLTTALSTHLRTMAQIELVSIEQLSYDEYIRSLPDPTVIGIIDMEPFSGQSIFELNPDIAFAIIDRLFGGMGRPLSGSRPFTDIEKAVLMKVFNWLLREFPEAWENIAQVVPRVRDIQSNTQFTQIVPGSDMTVLITLSAKISGNEGFMSICIPYIMLEPVVSKLNAQHWFSTTRAEQTAEHIQELHSRVKRVLLDIYADLGHAQLTIPELLSLQPGNVIKLERSAEEMVDIVIGDRVRFRGKAGVSNKHVAVKITDVVEEGEDVEDE